MLSPSSNRILIVDDSEEIHADFRRILNPPSSPPELLEMEADLFGSAVREACPFEFELTSAYQGQEALELVERGCAEGERFALAFVDMRMPPGWDGLETIEKLWEADPELQVVLCTAYSDYSWTELVARLGTTDQLLILKKPFDNIEVVQVACAITEKWKLARQARSKLDLLESMVDERTAELQSARDSLVQLNGELEQACAAAESARRSQSAFLANMSHEIRTPMNAVLGTVTLLRDSELTLDQREYVDTLGRSAGALLVLLNDLLDLSKIEAGHIELEAIDFDMGSIVEDVAELLASRAEEKGIELLTRYAPNAQRRMRGDPGRVRQVLNNLVSNAIKFTETGWVRIDIDTRSRGIGGFVVELVVSDSGIGIPPDRLESVFERFVQAEATTTRRFGGTGLGLAIVREMAELMGGSVHVDSEPGRGSRFQITLQLGDSGVSVPGGAAAPTGRAALVVGGSEALVAIVSEQLESLGVACERVETVDEACARIGACGEGSPRLVLVDDALFEEGRQLIQSCCAGEGGARCWPVLLTAFGARASADSIREAGYRGFLMKPTVSLHLSRLVSMAADDASAGSAPSFVTRRALVEPDASSDSFGAAPAGLSSGRILLVEDNSLNQKIAAHLLGRMGCEVEFASNGLEAVDQATRNEYDLILMDCQMPEMDGFTATQELRLRGVSVPVVALTANAMPSDREQCLAAGMDDYVAKPISAQDLAAALERWLPKRDGEPEKGKST